MAKKLRRVYINPIVTATNKIETFINELKIIKYTYIGELGSHAQ